MPVTVITSPGCQPCRITKRMLTDRGVEYRERNVADDPDALELAKSLGHNASPVVIAGEQHWSGFRPDLIAALG